MIEILFRGKRKDNDQWVHGFYFKRVRNYAGFKTEEQAYIKYETWDEGFVTYEVTLKTVGQFTGLTDKNGQKIFEGDILRGFCYPFRDGEGKHNYYAEIVWFSNSPAFGLITHKNPTSNVVGIADGNCEYLEDWDNTQWEVIGNVYDNPNLLKGVE